MRVTFDTNILVYAIDAGAGERHVRAIEVLDRAIDGDCVQPLQSYAEFMYVVTRRGPFHEDVALRLVASWREVYETCLANETAFDDALVYRREHGLSLWDAMLWATAKQAGCRVLFTEDFQDGRTLDGVTFVNPFVPANARYVELALPPP